MGLSDTSYLKVARPVVALPVELADAIAQSCENISHNLHGQRLGRKGRLTRERILAAAIELLDASCGEAFTLGNVAKRCSLGLTSLYNYFTDLTELMLAVLDPVMATAEESYLVILRERWPDDELAQKCIEFVRRYHAFWLRHSRLLHLRNSLADQRDERMFAHRVNSTRPVIELLVRQMDDEIPSRGDSAPMATMLMIGVERSVTIATDLDIREIAGMGPDVDVDRYLLPGARLMELAIRDLRSKGSS